MFAQRYKFFRYTGVEDNILSQVDTAKKKNENFFFRWACFVFVGSDFLAFFLRFEGGNRGGRGVQTDLSVELAAGAVGG